MKIKHILKYACSWLFTALCLAEQLWLCVFLCAHFHVSLCEDEHRHQESEFAVGHTYFKCSHDNARHDADHHSHNLPEIKLQQDENGDFSTPEIVPFTEAVSHIRISSAAADKVSFYSLHETIPILQKYTMRC